MIERKFAKFCGDILTRQIARADEERKTLRSGIVGSFPLGLDVEVAIFHSLKKTLKVFARHPQSETERGGDL